MIALSGVMNYATLAGKELGDLKAVMNGEKIVESLSIDKAAVDPEDVEMLQDLIVSAINECGKKVDEMMQSEMAKLTSGLGLPPGMI